jgi:hypothetical protein
MSWLRGAHVAHQDTVEPVWRSAAKQISIVSNFGQFTRQAALNVNAVFHALRLRQRVSACAQLIKGAHTIAMNDVGAWVALLTVACGIVAIALPRLRHMWLLNDPHRRTKPLSPWIRRLGLAMVLVGLSAAAYFVGLQTA